MAGVAGVVPLPLTNAPAAAPDTPHPGQSPPPAVVPPASSADGAAPVPSLTRITGMDGLRSHGVPVKVPGADPSQHKLSPTEVFLFGLTDGMTNADDIVAASGFKSIDAAWSFYHLKELGLITFREDADEHAARRDSTGAIRPEESARSVIGAVTLQKVASTPPGPARPDPAAEAQALLDQARASAARGEFDEARAQVRMAWMLAPDKSTVEPIKAQLEAAEHAPARAWTLHQLALACVATQPQVALLHWERALKEYEAPTIHVHVARVFVQLGQPVERSVQHAQRALQLEPTNFDATVLIKQLTGR